MAFSMCHLINKAHRYHHPSRTPLCHPYLDLLSTLISMNELATLDPAIVTALDANSLPREALL